MAQQVTGHFPLDSGGSSCSLSPQLWSHPTVFPSQQLCHIFPAAQWLPFLLFAAHAVSTGADALELGYCSHHLFWGRSPNSYMATFRHFCGFKNINDPAAFAAPGISIPFLHWDSRTKDLTGLASHGKKTQKSAGDTRLRARYWSAGSSWLFLIIPCNWKGRGEHCWCFWSLNHSTSQQNTKELRGERNHWSTQSKQEENNLQ